MAFALETLINRLEKKNIAIEKRSATTKKHSAKYIKQGRKPVWAKNYVCGDLESSVRELRHLIKDKREILKLIAEAKKNQIVLPETLDNYRKELEVSLKDSRIAHRERLNFIWEDEMKPLRNAVTHDIFNKFRNTEYRNLFSYDYCSGVYTLDFGAEKKIAEEDKEDLKIFLEGQKAERFYHKHSEAMHETDASIEKRSAKDAKSLVEDLYTRTFGYTGKTEDYSGLRVSFDNRGYSIINGIVSGEKGSCKVESISAGGYNIQCWHIRVLVHGYEKK